MFRTHLLLPTLLLFACLSETAQAQTASISPTYRVTILKVSTIGSYWEDTDVILETQDYDAAVALYDILVIALEEGWIHTLLGYDDWQTMIIDVDLKVDRNIQRASRNLAPTLRTSSHLFQRSSR